MGVTGTEEALLQSVERRAARRDAQEKRASEHDAEDSEHRGASVRSRACRWRGCVTF